jgi:ribosome-binding protein aMBF1 (putative translation factor)
MNDGSSDIRLTDAAPRGKWNRLLNARLLSFDLPDDWEQNALKGEPKKARKTNRRTVPKIIPSLSSQEVLTARKNLKLSQRSLADQIGKSQSWIRDVESGRLQANLRDQALLRKVLGMA